ncbi:hypothetical protein PV08_07328 [Exophiala spinifera]|uniref:Ketoreductase (KR) domain-containing protein n=1 Tax=Exophiala spinifera TaxID=91928 RepID=A0A0D2BTJ6_9EURO|nr:uncharacterized protein PV08_07328 [Exophiala spinifera]KIW14544.1 hypothetical protein PV08_07328 [Exophiala spinifera]
MVGVIQFFRGQFQTPPLPKVDLAGRTIAITGANSGLGLEAAKQLVQLNCSTIVLVCRTLAKGEEARKIIEATSSGNGRKPQFALLELDLGSFASVVACAEKFRDLPRLDAAILNAGVELHKFSLSEGYESTITVNVISTFLLATLLIPTLRQSAAKHNIAPVLSVTGSAVHFWANARDLTTPPDGQILKTLSDSQKANMRERYFLSKLPVMLLVKRFAKVLTASAEADPIGKPLVVINNVAPGLCNTNLFRDAPAATRLVLSRVARSSEHGARTLVHGGTAGKETHGQYLSECQVKPYSPFVKSKEGDKTAERLWDELSVIYEGLKPGCTKEL